MARRLPADFQPSWIQHRILKDPSRVVVACCGRRVGKTWIGAHWLAKRTLAKMAALAVEVRAGTRERACSEGKPARIARYLPPDLVAWIVAPRETHLDEARGHLLKLFAQAGWEQYLHPSFPGGIYDRGHQMYLLHAGVCARIDFIPASSEGRMVGKSLDIVWIDEAGFLDNQRYQALKPATMDKRAEMLCTGTPDLGDDHWFTKLAKAGLPEGHERSDPLVKRQPEVSTYIADTVTHAALKEAREEAVKEARFWGERWAARWIYADWRMRGRHIYDEFNADLHVQTYRLRGAVWWLGNYRLPRPDSVIGAIDWSGGSAPGAAVIAQVWRTNPIDPDDPRPLLVLAWDHQGYEAYSSDGWWGLLRSADRKWSVDRWVGDPHAPVLIEQANAAGIYVEPGAAADKMGRISMVASMLHHTQATEDRAEVRPALYVSRRCEHTMEQFSQYAWATTKQGEILDKPKQYNDHCMDCVAMLVPEIGEGACWIGTEAYG